MGVPRASPRAHLVLSTGEPTVSFERFGTPSGAASGIFHCEPAAASASRGATRRIGWHERNSLKPRRGVLRMGDLRPWPRAHRVLSTGKPTVSTDWVDTPSCSASGIFHCEPDAASAIEWGESSHRLVRMKFAQTKMWRSWNRFVAGVAASAPRSEHGGTHGEHRPARHAERHGEWNISL